MHGLADQYYNNISSWVFHIQMGAIQPRHLGRSCKGSEEANRATEALAGGDLLLMPSQKEERLYES